jgi:hypothetical protein
MMIAATAIAEGVPLFTTNPDDFTGIDTLVQVIPVTRPPVPHGKANLDAKKVRASIN